MLLFISQGSFLLSKYMLFNQVEYLVLNQKSCSLSHGCVVVGQGEGVATVENQHVDDPQTGKFTWNIENFSKLSLRKHYSETFTVGGYKW